MGKWRSSWCDRPVALRLGLALMVAILLALEPCGLPALADIYIAGGAVMVVGTILIPARWGR